MYGIVEQKYFLFSKFFVYNDKEIAANGTSGLRCKGKLGFFFSLDLLSMKSNGRKHQEEVDFQRINLERAENMNHCFTLLNWNVATYRAVQ